MTLVRLLNENWGFDSNCFVCETKNPTGLRIPFHHDTDTDQVVADFNLGNEFSGAPSYVHGGVSLSILDEAQAWATIAVGGKFAVTSTTSTTFDLPVLVGRDYRVSALARLGQRRHDRHPCRDHVRVRGQGVCDVDRDLHRSLGLRAPSVRSAPT